MKNKILITFIAFVLLIPQIALANLSGLEEETNEQTVEEEVKTELEKEAINDTSETKEKVELEENNSTDETEELEANEVDQDLEEVEEELTDEADEVEEQVVETRQLITTLRGVALKAPTAVRQSKNQASKALKTYSKGHILIYREAPGDWYEATVYLNGKPTKGYIYKSDVENITPNGKHLNGFSTKVPLNVYKKADRASGHWKSYGYGSKLIYKEFSKNWYEATVYVSGKAQTGYIHKSDVSASEPGALKPIFGYGQVNPTRVYERTSKKSKTLKSYKRGSRLKYEDYDGTWYKATVYLKGKPVTGYIHKNDVNLNKPAQVVTINGYGHASPTRVYQKTNKNSRVLKSYKKGSKLKYQKYNGTWYKATVYLNGKPQTGYIHKNDVNVNQPSFFGYAQKNKTYVYASKSKGSKKLKGYNSGVKLKYKRHNSNWHEATVYLNGKAVKGYISNYDVANTKPNMADKLKTIDGNNQLVLVTAGGYGTNKARIRTYERNKSGTWTLKISAPAHLGKNGFASNKREGDGKSPVGKYTFGTAFGQRGNPGTKLPFKNITSRDVWVDDPKSVHYNTWQYKENNKGLWNSAENMNHRLYTNGVVINYNTAQTPYKGSAIFLHVGNSYTAGCTATAESHVVSIMKWLDPKKKPVIIQTVEKDLGKY